MSKLNLDKLTYSETRSINFGDYESRSFFVSLGCEVTKDGLKISEGITESDIVSFEKSITSISEKVAYFLDRKEAAIRKTVIDNGYNVPDDESFEKKLLEVQQRIKAHKVKKEMKKARKV